MNNSRILTIKNVKFSEYYFYKNLNTLGDFQICITVALSKKSLRIEGMGLELAFVIHNYC